MKLARLAGFLAVILVSQFRAPAQSAATGSLELKGKVLNAATGSPIPRALVEYINFPTSSNSQENELQRRHAPLGGNTFTDAAGAFLFTGLVAGPCTVFAARPQFLKQNQTIQLDSSTKEIDLRLSPLLVISGTVTDDDGKPLRGVNIVLEESTVSDGHRTLRETRSVATDDLGQYRFWNLSPGKYLLKAAGRSGGTLLYSSERLPTFSAAECFAPTYYGGSPDWHSATPLDFRSGQSVTADFRLSLRPARRIRGMLSGMTLFRSAKFELMDNQGNTVATRAALSGAGGRFELLDVPPGTYQIRVTQVDRADGTVYGQAQVSVEAGDADDIGIALRPGVDVAIVPHCKSDPALQQSTIPVQSCIFLKLTKADGENDFSPAHEAFRGIPPGQYNFSAIGTNNYAASVQLGGRDIRPNQLVSISEGSGPFEIWTASDGGQLKVRLDLSDKLAGDAETISILAIPLFDSFQGNLAVDLRLLEYHTLAPGDYTLFALRNSDLQALEYRNPDILRTLGLGTAIRVEPNATATVVIGSLAK